MPETAVVFQARADFERARRALEEAGAAFRAIEPPPEVARVAVPFLVIPDASRGPLHEAVREGVALAGRVPYRAPADDPLADLPPAPAAGEDVVGRLVIAFVAPCVAAEDEIRLTAHTGGDLGPVLPYLNAEIPAGTYGPAGPTFTLMDGPRLVTLSPRRIAVSRCREMVDAWRTLESIRRRVLDVWARRDAIEPSTERRVQVTALEVYGRTPQINCGACGEATCMAFAARLVAGEQRPEHCTPAYEGEYPHLRAGLEAIAARLGL
ncbi:MAG: (Fe-S)-binding protein [Phycisphaerae bacterium]